MVKNVATSSGFGLSSAASMFDASNIDAKDPASASVPDVKLAPPPSLASADASAEHAHVVLVDVQLTGLQRVAS